MLKHFLLLIFILSMVNAPLRGRPNNRDVLHVPLGLSDAAMLPTGETAFPHAAANAVVTRPHLDDPRQAATARTCDDTIGTLTMPLSGRETSQFGLRADPLGGGVRLHAGIDLAAPFGSPVKSSASGEVVRAGWAGGYGNMIVIDHGHGLTTYYAHLERTLVHPGEFVSHGQEIGLVGATGHATGSHLHFEIRIDNHALDPDRAPMACPIAADPGAPALAHTLDEVPARSGWNGPNEGLPTTILH